MTTSARNVYSFIDISPSIMADAGNSAANISVNRHKQPHGISYTSAIDLNHVCIDGERTDYLTKIAGTFINKGYPIVEVITLARGWNAKNNPPLDDEKIISTCYSIQKSHQRNHGTALVPAEITPLFDLSSASVARYLDNPPPARRWLLKDCLPAGKVGMLVAKGGTGKSMLMMQMAISVASGTTLAGTWEIGEKGAVLALFAEDDEEEIHRRLRNCFDAMAPSVPDVLEFNNLLDSNLYVKSMVSENNLMTSVVKGSEISQTDYVNRLAMTAAGITSLKLIIIDPASRFRGGDENASQDGTRFVEALEKLAKDTGAAVLVVHHMNKGSASSSEQSQDASRGSSAFTDGVRWQMNLATFTKDEAKEFGINDERRGYYLTATITKNNYAAPQPKVLLTRLDGGYLANAGLTSTKVQKTADNLHKVIELVASEAKRGKKYSKTAFEDTFGGLEKSLKIGKVALRGLMTAAIKSDKLLKINGKLALPGSKIQRAEIVLVE